MSWKNPEQKRAWLAAYRADPVKKEKMRKYAHAWYMVNKEKHGNLHKTPAYKAYMRAWNADRNNWPTITLARLRTKSKKFNIPFDLDLADLAIPAVCPVFGTSFETSKRGSRLMPSVDRLRPALGYVKGNVRIISHRANSIKSDATSAQELRQVAAYMEQEGLL